MPGDWLWTGRSLEGGENHQVEITCARAELEAVADRQSLDLVVAFGSTAKNGHGRDLDLALQPADPWLSFQRPLELMRELSSALQRSDLDLVWLPDSSWLLCWQVARDGVVVYERHPGSFRRWSQAAYWRQQDSDLWRQLGEAYLARYLKGDASVDHDLVLHRTAERDLELLVECAASSFFALTRGWLDSQTARELSDCARLRNLLVQQYERVALPQVYAAVRRSLPFWKRYLEATLPVSQQTHGSADGAGGPAGAPAG